MCPDCVLCFQVDCVSGLLLEMTLVCLILLPNRNGVLVCPMLSSLPCFAGPALICPILTVMGMGRVLVCPVLSSLSCFAGMGCANIPTVSERVSETLKYCKLSGEGE